MGHRLHKTHTRRLNCYCRRVFTLVCHRLLCCNSRWQGQKSTFVSNWFVHCVACVIYNAIRCRQTLFFKHRLNWSSILSRYQCYILQRFAFGRSFVHSFAYYNHSFADNQCSCLHKITACCSKKHILPNITIPIDTYCRKTVCEL